MSLPRYDGGGRPIRRPFILNCSWISLANRVGNSWLIYNWKGQRLHRSISLFHRGGEICSAHSEAVWELNCVAKWFSCIKVYAYSYLHAEWNSQQPWNETILMNELIQKRWSGFRLRKTIVTKINSDGARPRGEIKTVAREVCNLAFFCTLSLKRNHMSWHFLLLE